MSTRVSRLIGGLAAAALVVAGVGLAAGPATAADANTGWVRVGHFSPNTKAVDVRITALAGGSALYSLDHVAYGQVSGYLDMQAGSYVVSMRPSSAPSSTKPIITQSFTVKAGTASTVAAYGPNGKLKTSVFADSLAAPSTGQARIRLIQVSTRHPKVTLTTSGGQVLAKNARSGTATDYASVAAGDWSLTVSGSGADASAPVSLGSGSVDTVLVLDNADGGVSVRTLVDSAGAAAEPSGGIQTGGGYLAEHGGHTDLAPAHRAGR
jgi:hypothetical protein